MEAVPRMPMLAFELKHCSEHEEFTTKLKSYIEDFYNENPENYNKECQELEQLCQTVVNIPHDFTGCSTLKKYFCQLQFLQSRFPIEDGGILAMPFTWECVYTGKSVTVTDVRFEQACVLYNVGALHSILGALDNRQSPEGMKVSCTHFQCAAWAFQHVRDTFGSGMTPDLTFDLLSFQTTLMLGQSQECILEKSMSDNRKNTITAKIACQIVDYYRQAIKHLDSKECAVVGHKRIKEWKWRLEMKITYLQAITYYYLGSDSVDRQKWGEAVTYLQASQNKLVEAGKASKHGEEHEDIDTTLTFANDVIAGKFTSVKKDNDFVYHEKVPELESLPELKGASLVKGIPFDPTDENISGPDIFRRLVPMEAHQASSVYSEVKANLLRSVSGRIEEKNNELQQYMASLQLETSKLFPEGPTRLPQELLEKCAAISVKPGAIQDLIDAMQSLSTIATDTDGNISEIFGLLEAEAAAEKDFQEKYGRRGHNVTLDEIQKECTKYKEGIQTASQSNQDLHKAMGTHISNLKLLSSSLDEIQKALPSPEQQKTPEDDEVIQEMRRLMDKVEEMRSQRSNLEEKLRKDIHADDVTAALVTREGSSQEEFFQTQLQKHDSHIDLIDRNLAAQPNILKALTESNAKYARIRKLLKDCEQRRESMIVDLKTSYDVYEELLAKTQKGIDFYRKLEENVKRLLERSHRVCKVQHEEREQILERLKPKAPPPSRPSAPKPGAPRAPDPPVAMAPGLDPSSNAAGLPDPAGMVPGLDPAAMMMSLPSTKPQGEQPLKLKDFLPFMKPKTFGADRGKPGTDVASYPANEIPGVPTSQSGSPLHHAAGQPSGQSVDPTQAGAMGELRLDGGRLPLSINDEMAPLPSIPGSQQPQFNINQPAVGPGQQRGGEMPPYPVNSSPLPVNQAATVSGAQTDGVGMTVQSPTAPPGAPSARAQVSHPGTSTQPPGGPQAGQGHSQHTPSQIHQIPPSAAGTTGQPPIRHTPSPQIPPPAPTGQPLNRHTPSPAQNQHIQPTSQPPIQPSPDPLQHGYTQVQYGAMGQPAYSRHGQQLPGQPLPHQPQSDQGLPQQQNQPIPGQMPNTQMLPQQQHQPLPSKQPAAPPSQMNPPASHPVSSMQTSQALPSQQQPLPSQFNQAAGSHTIYSTAQPVSGQPASQPSSTMSSTGAGTQPWQQGKDQIMGGPGQAHMFPGQNLPASNGMGAPNAPHVYPKQQQPGSGTIPQAGIAADPRMTISQSAPTGPMPPTSSVSSQSELQASQRHMQPMASHPQMSYPQPAGSQSHLTQPQNNIHAGGMARSGDQSQPQSHHQYPIHSQPHMASQANYTPSAQIHTGSGVIAGHGNVALNAHGQQQPLTTGTTSYTQGVSSSQASAGYNIQPGQLASQPQNVQNMQQNFANQPQQPHQASSQPYSNQATVPKSNQPQPPPVSHNTPAYVQAPGQIQGTYSNAGSNQSGMAQNIDPHGSSRGHLGQLIPNSSSANVGPGQVPNSQPAGYPGQLPRQTVPNLPKGQVMSSGQIPNIPSGQANPYSSHQQQIPQNYGSNVHNQQTGLGASGNQHVQPISTQNVSSQAYQGGQYSQGMNQQTRTQNQMSTSVRATMPPQVQMQTGYHGGPPQAFPQGQPQQQAAVRYPGPGQAIGGAQHARPQGPVSQPQGSVPPQNIPPQTRQNVRPTVAQTPSGQYNGTQPQYMPRAQQAGGQVFPQPNQGPVGGAQHQSQTNVQPVSQGQPLAPQGYQQHQGQMQVPGQVQGQGQMQGQVQGQGQFPGQGQTQNQGQRPMIPAQGQGQANVINSQGQMGQIKNVGPNQNQYMYSQTPNTQPAQNQPFQQNQMNPSPNFTGTGPRQDLLSQTPGYGASQAPILTPAVLQPSSAPMSPAGTPASNTPTDTPRPTPSQTPQPAVSGQPASPQRKVQNNQTGAGMQGIPPHTQQATTNQNMSPVRNSAIRNGIPISRQDSGASNAESLDFILSSSPSNAQMSPSKETVLRPRVVTEEEQAQQREEQMKSSLILHRDPYSDQDSLNKFVSEVEAYVKHVEGLTKHTLSGPTPLDKEWRDLAEHQERETRTLSMAIARCYPMKNRSPDVMPYDATRVVLKMGQDDYVNASHIKDIAATCPGFIAAQSPLPSTFVDFWQMVYEEGTEVIVMLNAINEPGMQKSHIYWPEEKTRPIHHGHFQLSLQSERKKNFWVERIVTLSHKETRHTRSVIHLQFDSWFPSGQPESPAQLLQFVTQVQSCYVQQRSLMKPVLVHCSDGIGRTGAFIAIYAMVQEVDHGKGIVDLCDVIRKLRLQRKWMVREKEQMKFCHETVLYHAQDLLMKRGILVNKASFEDKPGSKSHHVHTPTEDFIFGSPVPLSTIQSTVAKMTLKERQEPDGGEQTTLSSAPASHSSEVAPVSPLHTQVAHRSASSSPHATPKHSMSQQNTASQPVCAPTQQSVMSSQEVMMSAQVPAQQAMSQQSTGTQNTMMSSAQGGNQNTSEIQGNQPQSTTTGNVPLSLTDLQNPHTFNLGAPSTPPNKKRVTKSSFENQCGTLVQKTSQEEGDPLSMLDPLWTIKK